MQESEPDTGEPTTKPLPRSWPLSHQERVALFGAFTFEPSPTPQNPERVDIDDAWEKANLTTVTVRQLQGKKVRMHKLCVESFEALWNAWERAGLLGKVLTFDGMYAPRFKRFKGTVAERIKKAGLANAYDLSNHAWGTSFDVNAAWNRLGDQPADLKDTGTVRPLVGIAYEHGWYWGGHFRSRPDGMHFEYVGMSKNRGDKV